MPGPQQLTFALPVAEDRSRGAFFVAPSNALALRMLEEWQDWPAGKLILIGPQGAGKSHLAGIWQSSAGAQAIPPAALESADIAALATGNVLLDDAEQVAGEPAAEEALFHLFNALQAQGHALLLTARTPPRDWGLNLPDLQSRLSATATCRIGTPDQSLLAAVLVKQFADRQLVVPPNVISYLTPRMERSLDTAARLVAGIDRLALAEKRAVSRQLAARALAALEALDNAPEAGA